MYVHAGGRYGGIRRLSRSPARRACIVRVWTAPLCGITGQIHCCRILWFALPEYADAVLKATS